VAIPYLAIPSYTLAIQHTSEHTMNRWMFDESLYVCHCGLRVSIRDKSNAFLENSTTQFVVCQKNYTDPSRCRYFKYKIECIECRYFMLYQIEY
jgi:hypothetical protein